MSKAKALKVLYFLEGPIATPTQIEEATAMAEDGQFEVELVDLHSADLSKLDVPDAVAGVRHPSIFKDVPTFKSLAAKAKVKEEPKKSKDEASKDK